MRVLTYFLLCLMPYTCQGQDKGTPVELEVVVCPDSLFVFVGRTDWLIYAAPRDTTQNDEVKAVLDSLARRKYFRKPNKQ